MTKDCTKLAFLLTISFLFTTNTIAQNRSLPQQQWAVGAGFGISDLWGDIGTKTRIDHYKNQQYAAHLQGMATVNARYFAAPFLAARVNLSYGTIYATDKYNQELANSNPDKTNINYLLYNRNLDVRSRIFDAHLVAEIYPFRLSKGSNIAHWALQPYITGGIGIFHFNPQASYRNPETGVTKWVDIQPLHLEGEGLDYAGAPKGFNLWNMTVPLSLGLRYEVNEKWSISFEYLHRITFTDYLDGVSGVYVNPAIFDKYLSPEDAVIARAMSDKTPEINPSLAHSPGEVRGSAGKNDAYSSFFFQFSYTIPKKAYFYQ